MSSAVIVALVLGTAASPFRAHSDTLACVQDTVQQHRLERTVRDEFLQSPDWAPTRERWRWVATPGDVAAVTDSELCARAGRAIVAAGRRSGPSPAVVLVRAGNFYVAAPPDVGDEWIFLDLHWRVVEHVVVPS